MSERRHYPTPGAAILVCLGAWLATGAGVVLVAGDPAEIGIAELGLGQALGMGLVAALAARWVPEPRAVRVGIRGFDPRLLGALALLLPLSVVVSELLHWIHVWFPAPDAQEIAERSRERLAAETPLDLVETAIVVVGIAPLVEEWLYRGVIQQGVVAHLGRVRGVLLTAALFGLAHLQPGVSSAGSLAIFAAVLPLGVALGLARMATGSLLAAIGLHAGYNGIALALSEWGGASVAPGLEGQSGSLPLALLLPCAATAALGFAWLGRCARQTPRALPLPQPGPGDDPRWLG